MIARQTAPPEPMDHEWNRLRKGLVHRGGHFLGFLFLALLAAQGFDLVRANALKLPMILGFTVLAVTLFAASGKVVWTAGLTMAAGQFVGAKLGVHLQVLKGQEWVRRVLTVMVVLFAVRLALG